MQAEVPGVSEPFPQPFAVVATSAGFRAGYDRNGNMLVRVEVSGTERITYTQAWDVENRLSVVTNTVSGEVTRLVYDGDGNRVLREDAGGVTAYFNAVEVHITGTQRVTKTYYFASGQRIWMREGITVTYLHGDHLGSASLATDASGGVVSAMRYTPYGVTRYGTAPTIHRFTDHRWEGGLGLYDYGARFYSPGVGRFVSADTIVPDPGSPQEWNRYAYVLNNPLRFIDPSGHQIEPPTYQPNAIQHTGTAGAQVYNSSAIFQVNPTQVSYPSVESIEALVSYHEFQGVGTTWCGDYSISMAYNIWSDHTSPLPTWFTVLQHKSGSDITPLIDSRLLGRFPIVGGATPFGVDHALEQLGVPFRRDLLGDNMGNLRLELYEGHPVILSIGAVGIEPGEQQLLWGHVIVAVGYDDELVRYGFLDPWYPQSNIRWMTEAELRDEWWYRPFINPMWVVGEEE